MREGPLAAMITFLGKSSYRAEKRDIEIRVHLLVGWDEFELVGVKVYTRGYVGLG